ncbi:MAG: MBL fold metallo-hydrolase [Candidatus Symbiothrix sp.]|jgi:beta-lactamase superfamily II metal-dependent hydrolase|nr:MBL fold metallo-hydrolase [Candidatus Symbiothrix sp.]
MNKCALLLKNLVVIVLLGLLSCNTLFSQEIQVGDPLPLWSDGYLDIHFVNTGKGESAFYILPDGTTLLVDAGVTLASEVRGIATRPNTSRTPGEWIARYIRHFSPDRNNGKLNYIMTSHFHEDHIGGITPETKSSPAGQYKLSGITEVGDLLSCDKLIDRGWPDYDYPVPLTSNVGINYIKFAQWMEKNKKGTVEQFKVGVNNQLTLVNNPQRYPNFEIRNIASNGYIWTGVADNSRNHLPPIKDIPKEDIPDQNAFSIAFRLSYGKFDFFTGGDIYSVTDYLWQNMETPIGLVTGPVEVCKANHHGNFDTMGKDFLQALRPRAIVIHNWIAQQPDMAVLRRMLSTKTYPGPRDVFTTNMRNETIIVAGWAMERLKSQQGHVVVRVSPGGDHYSIYILDDSEESYNVKAVFGPYLSD